MAEEGQLGEPLEGGCQCGAVRYRVHAAAHEIYHCHCSMCRKLHGALFVTWAVVPRGRLEVTRGEGGLATFESSPGVRRRFCRDCGCHFICEIDSDPDFDWFTPGTLDGGVHPGHARNDIQSGTGVVRNAFMSVDPYMRGRMRPGRSYVAPFQLGEPLDGAAVVRTGAAGQNRLTLSRHNNSPGLRAGNYQ